MRIHTSSGASETKAARWRLHGAARLGLIAVALSLVATACGSSGGEASSGSSQTPSATNGEASAPTSQASSASPSAAGAELPAEIKDRGYIQFATDPTNPPLAYEEGGKTVGIDPEIAGAIAKELGVELRITSIKFAGIIPALESKRFDMAMAGMSDLKTRQEKVDFVDYLNNGYVLVVRTGNPENLHSLADLCGKKAAAHKGAQEALLLEQQSDKCKADGKGAISILYYDDVPTTRLALQQGRVSVFLQGNVAATYASKLSDGQVEMVPPTGDLISPSPFGIAFPKGSELVPAVQAALQRIIDDGTYGEILKKWNISPSALKTATINAGN